MSTNSVLDRFVRPEIHLLRWPVSSFKVCGYTGLFLAIVQSIALVLHLGLSLGVLAGIVAVGVFTFFALVMATKIVTGEEAIIYYHHEIAVLATTALFLVAIGVPVVRYLEITLLGIGLFLACGRVGCLMVGCCHGRPSRWGVRYRSHHARAGFPPCYVGVRLLPVQGIESLFVAMAVVLGVTVIVSGGAPGEALAWYTVIYGTGRFWLEFLRGDGARPYYAGFSQAQWISVVLAGMVLWAAWRGALPFRAWQAGVIASLPAAMLVLAVWRRARRVPLHRLLHARHVQEVAEALLRARQPHRPGGPPRVETTTLGLAVSGAVLRRPGSRVSHYTLSSRAIPLTDAAVRALAGLILRLRHPPSHVAQIVPGAAGTVHLIVDVPRRPALTRPGGRRTMRGRPADAVGQWRSWERA